MIGLLTYLDEGEHEAVRQAARQAGMSMRRWVRLSVVDASRSALGQGDASMYSLLLKIAKTVCTDARPHHADAVAALVKLGIPEKMAKMRVQAVATPRASTEEIVTQALKGT